MNRSPRRAMTPPDSSRPRHSSDAGSCGSRAPRTPGALDADGRVSGMALIIVLVSLAVLTILVVSFLSEAMTELTSSKQYSVSAGTQNLAASALNYAMGQVAGGASATSTAISWASQPGMIRQFANDGTTNASALYKLYSSSNMVVLNANGAAGITNVFDDLASNWDSNPALYTDLNSPIIHNIGGITNEIFPIVDPRASVNTSNSLTTNDAVVGFSYDTNTIRGIVAATNAVTDTNARLPMPVMWLYVLKNGSIVAPTSTTSGPNQTVTVAGAELTNPIVGRIAFWTDDESCRVNINTASEGVYWDVPMCNYSSDALLNAHFATGGEFQRYPGHPATTSLSAVFPWLKTLSAATPTTVTNSGADSGNYNSASVTLSNNLIYDISPRIRQGGSYEGTCWPGTNVSNVILPKSDRMYDSVDELAFNAARGTNPNLLPGDIENRRFFLTAQSRSPELTLFNTPRVVIWPFHAKTNGWHSTEKLIALAGTVGPVGTGSQYYFTRSTPLDPMGDFNDTISNIPGRPSGRNGQLIAYLQNLTSQSIPGFGTTTFASKWTTPERDQILIEIYDYIRSCVNLTTMVTNGVVTTNPSSAWGYTMGGWNGSIASATNSRRGQVYPTVLSSGQAVGVGGNTLSTNVSGFGRFPTIREVSIGFACQSNPVMMPTNSTTVNLPATTTNGGIEVLCGIDTNWHTDPTYVSPATMDTNGNQLLEAPLPAILWPYLVVDLFLPSQGLKQWIPNVRVTAVISNNMTWTLRNPNGTDTPISMFTNNTPATAMTMIADQNSSGWGDQGDGFLGYQLLLSSKTALTNYTCGPMASNWAPDFLFNGGTVTLTLDVAENAASGGGPTNYPANPATVMAANLTKQFVITFPAMTNRLPNPYPAWYSSNTSGSMCPNTYSNRINGLYMLHGGSMNNIIIDALEGLCQCYPQLTVQLFGQFSGFYGDVTSTSNRFTPGTITNIGTSNNVILSFTPAGSVTNTYKPLFDILKSMIIGGSGAGNGDIRLVAASGATVTGGSYRTNLFVPCTNYFFGLPSNATVSSNSTWYNRLAGSSAFVRGSTNYNAIVTGYNVMTGLQPGNTLSTTSNLNFMIPVDVKVTNSRGKPGDWDSGLGNTSDGPYIGKVDEGNDSPYNINYTDYNQGSYLMGSWSCIFWTNRVLDRAFGPMRMIASPVAFGSLPTGVVRQQPWQTLLFCPNPAAGTTSSEHLGFVSPPDHLMLDLFWMPVTEPYAISEAMSTAGKINLNYQILPFTHIKRQTGLYAILQNECLPAFGTKIGLLGYKSWNVWQYGYFGSYGPTPGISRYAIDVSNTLTQFDTKFAGGTIFKSASQICENFLVPLGAGQTLATTTNMTTGFWSTNTLTGDNAREHPYNAIYPRITTQSSVYTVYVRAQSLTQLPATLQNNPATFTQGKDIQGGDFQASYTFERYLDPNTVTTTNDMTPLGQYYKLRVIHQRNFSQ